MACGSAPEPETDNCRGTTLPVPLIVNVAFRFVSELGVYTSVRSQLAFGAIAPVHAFDEIESWESMSVNVSELRVALPQFLIVTVELTPVPTNVG